jgi:CubicO group peptidase (beta-lactamase class C family)
MFQRMHYKSKYKRASFGSFFLRDDYVSGILALFAFLLVSTGAIWCQSSMDTSRSAPDPLYDKSIQVDSLFAPWSGEDTPGVAVLVMKDQKILFKKGFGLENISKKIPITPETVFELCSITKQFTAMAVMMLVERGKLSFSDPLTKFFPAFPDYARKITIRHLLNHTSGLEDYVELLIRSGKIDSDFESPSDRTDWPFEPTDKDILALLFKQKFLRFIPGDEYEYCNSGYIVLGQIVEKISGKKLSQFLAENILRPLGMKNTVLNDETKPKVPHLAVSYMPAGNELKGVNYTSTRSVYGDGGLQSSLNDLIKWFDALENNRLVKTSTLKQAFTSGKLNSGANTGYGFGWYVGNAFGLERVTHSGTYIGFHHVLMYYPQQHFIALVLSNDGRLTYPDRSVLINRLAKIYLRDRMILPPTVQISTEGIRQYAGRYAYEDGTPVNISFEDGSLWVRSNNLLPVKLLAESGNKFFVENAEDDWYSFVKDNNKVIGINIHLSYYGYNSNSYNWLRRL